MYIYINIHIEHIHICINLLISTNVPTVLQQLPPEILRHQPWNRSLRHQSQKHVTAHSLMDHLGSK